MRLGIEIPTMPRGPNSWMSKVREMSRVRLTLPWSSHIGHSILVVVTPVWGENSYYNRGTHVMSSEIHRWVRGDNMVVVNGMLWEKCGI